MCKISELPYTLNRFFANRKGIFDKYSSESFLDTQVSLAPTHVSWSVRWLVRPLVGPSVGDTFEFPKSIFAKCTRFVFLLSFASLLICYQIPLGFPTLPLRFSKIGSSQEIVCFWYVLMFPWGWGNLKYSITRERI